MLVVFSTFEIYLLPIAILILCILLIIFWRKKHSVSYLICFTLFSIYVLFAVDKVFFPIPINNILSYSARNFRFGVNLVPFRFDFSILPRAVLLQILQNILLTVPFGFGVSFIVRLTAKNFLWLIPLVGIGIEATQAFISLLLGYPYRVIDINDVIMNTLGIVVGYVLFRLFSWFYVWMTEYFGIKHVGLSAYIYDVAYRAQAQ